MASISERGCRAGTLAGALLLSGCGLFLMGLAPKGTALLPAPSPAPPAKQISEPLPVGSTGDRGGCGSCPSGAYDEGESCGVQINGGCDDQSFSYTQVNCDTEVCGRSWAEVGMADIDWYEVFLQDTDGDSQDVLRVKVESQLPLLVEIYDGCFGAPLVVTDSDGCDEAFAELCLEAPKLYYIRVLPGSISTGPITNGFPCFANWEYRLQIECEDTCGTTGTCPPCIPAPESLLAWWAMDDLGTATSIYELIHENNALPQGAVTPGLPGKVDNAVKFAGGHLVAPDQDRLDFKVDRDFSVLAWIQLPTDPTDVHPIIDKRSPEGDPKLGWSMTTYGGKLALIMNDIDGASDLWLTNVAIGDGGWHHVAVTVDRDMTNGINFYIDGNLVDTYDPTTVPGDLSTDSDILIGRSQRLDGQSVEATFQGYIDELQVFHRSLTGPEVSGLATADCGGACKVRMHIPRITPYCEGQVQSPSIVTISNATNQDRSFNLFYDGLASDPNSTDYCIQDGPTVFTPGMTNPIFVPAGSTVEVPLLIDRPSGLQSLGDSACWTTTLQEVGGGGLELVRKATVSVNEDICVEAETNGVLSIPVGQPTPVKFTLVNQTTSDAPYFWKIACVKSVGGALNDMVQLNNEEPGDELFGYTVVPGGGTADVVVNVHFLRQRGKSERAGYSDVVIYREPGTDVPWYGGDSQGVESSESPVETCGADINCDGVVDVTDLLAVIAAWGDCPEDAACPEDINEDGVVDVTDLLAVIAGWG
ncbi:MAG: LamG domain-containing protein [Phycisphaerales bacterium]|nr:LamG domain-containing protein [Phycisphaerales bacterium]